MRKLLLVSFCGGMLSSPIVMADPYQDYLDTQNQRGIKIELIRVANEKPLVGSEETDEEVAAILDEIESLEADSESDDVDTETL